MAFSITVDNIKCHGCANSIRKEIRERHGVDAVEVDVAQGVVSVAAAPELEAAVAQTLLGLGYPQRGSVEGIGSLKAKAKSFVSCAIGRMND